ncbi:hypothetical protein [Coprothermobacter platensis]|uniref:hypothetical protein n=1 Tax=Coprothermobacter platensis TaxID=108819 RepID=UPI000370DA94|nr:hypothetical protein [Coprothermobacter platensis]
MKINGSEFIDPKHIDLVKRVSQKFSLNEAQKAEKKGESSTDVILAKVLQQFKVGRSEYVESVKTRNVDADHTTKQIAESLVEKTKEDAGR